MQLHLTIRITSDYTGKSAFEPFKSIKKGDVLKITSPFEWPEGRRGHTYAQKVSIRHIHSTHEYTDSLRGIINRLSKTTYEEVIGEYTSDGMS